MLSDAYGQLVMSSAAELRKPGDLSFTGLARIIHQFVGRNE